MASRQNLLHCAVCVITSKITKIMKGTKVQTLGARAVAGAWYMAGCLGHNNNYSSRRHTHRHTDTQNDYCNPRCACAPRVNNCVFLCNSTFQANLNNLISSKINDHGKQIDISRLVSMPEKENFDNYLFLMLLIPCVSTDTMHIHCNSVTIVGWHNYSHS